MSQVRVEFPFHVIIKINQITIMQGSHKHKFLCLFHIKILGVHKIMEEMHTIHKKQQISLKHLK